MRATRVLRGFCSQRFY